MRRRAYHNNTNRYDPPAECYRIDPDMKQFFKCSMECLKCAMPYPEGITERQKKTDAVLMVYRRKFGPLVTAGIKANLETATEEQIDTTAQMLGL